MCGQHVIANYGLVLGAICVVQMEDAKPADTNKDLLAWMQFLHGNAEMPGGAKVSPNHWKNLHDLG